jgi:hypothetical protein
LAKFKPEVFEPFLTKYEHFLKENGGEHFVGKQVSFNIVTDGVGAPVPVPK